MVWQCTWMLEKSTYGTSQRCRRIWQSEERIWLRVWLEFDNSRQFVDIHWIIQTIWMGRDWLNNSGKFHIFAAFLWPLKLCQNKQLGQQTLEALQLPMYKRNPLVYCWHRKTFSQHLHINTHQNRVKMPKTESAWPHNVAGTLARSVRAGFGLASRQE